MVILDDHRRSPPILSGGCCGAGVPMIPPTHSSISRSFLAFGESPCALCWLLLLNTCKRGITVLSSGCSNNSSSSLSCCVFAALNVCNISRSSNGRPLIHAIASEHMRHAFVSKSSGALQWGHPRRWSIIATITSPIGPKKNPSRNPSTCEFRLLPIQPPIPPVIRAPTAPTATQAHRMFDSIGMAYPSKRCPRPTSPLESNPAPSHRATRIRPESFDSVRIDKITHKPRVSV